MARIKTTYPIESLSGKVKKAHKTGFALRQASKNNFTVTRDDWSLKTRNYANETLFSQAAAAAVVRKNDSSKIVADTQNFKAQSKYTTMFGYLFSLEYARLKNAQVDPDDE